MSSAWLWLAGLVAAPAAVVAASWMRLDVERLRRLAVVAAGAMLVWSLGVTISPALRQLSVRSSTLTGAAGGEEILRVEIYRRGLHSDAFEHANLRPRLPAANPAQ